MDRVDAAPFPMGRHRGVGFGGCRLKGVVPPSPAATAGKEQHHQEASRNDSLKAHYDLGVVISNPLKQ
jgi:hypothetical protein